MHELLVVQVVQKLVQERPGNPIEQHPFEQAHLTMVIRDRIDAWLLGGNPRIEITDLRLTLPDDRHAVAVIRGFGNFIEAVVQTLNEELPPNPPVP